MQLVKIVGPTKWNNHAIYLMGRSGKQCRERWCGILNPMNKKNEPWDCNEKYLLYLLNRDLKCKWSEYALLLEGRPDNLIKNFWNS